MFLFAPLLVLGAIGVFCWLLFTLAVFALPTVAGVYAGIWAFHTGAGALGAIVVGLVAAGATFGIGQLLLIFVPWTWAKLLIVAVYTAPAVAAGYGAIRKNGAVPGRVDARDAPRAPFCHEQIARSVERHADRGTETVP